MGNDNSLPAVKQQRTKAFRSARPHRKFTEFGKVRRSSTDSTASSTGQSQQCSQNQLIKCRSYPPHCNSLHENCCSKLGSDNHEALNQKLSCDTLSDHNLKSGLLSPQSTTLLGKDNHRLYVDRRRSKSLCSQQLRADCLTVSAAVTSVAPTRRTSNGVVQSLTKLRIQQCFKAAKPNMGQLILKRACSLRGEIRSFLSHLSSEKVDDLAIEFYNFLSDCVEKTDDAESVKSISKKFGEHLANLSSSGFRPDYLTPIADAAIAECVKLDGGAHKRCETLSAWSQLITVMFTNVRDGYYETMREHRRISLPHFQARLNMSNLNEKSRICA
uniref:GLOBIN domain-containing protein n=1 Tax=Syphacia muris TaxID=451379 RepID=A0A0N5AAD3_9BILA